MSANGQSSERRGFATSYVLAGALPLATLWARQVLLAAPADSPAFILFSVPVFLSAYFGGLGPGMVTTILSGLCVDYFMLAPIGSFAIDRPFDAFNLLVFAGLGGAASVASERLHRTRRAVQASRLLAASLTHAAQHDSLTDLPNRRLFTARLEHAIALTERSGALGALLFLDLDDFKDINNAYGHAAGDELLVAVAARLRNQLRQTDTPARFGGDEFVVLLEGLAEPETAATVARALIARLAEPIVLGGTQAVSVGVSIGISLFPLDAQDAEGALRHADAALYRAKAAGRATYRFFDDPSPAASDSERALG